MKVIVIGAGIAGLSAALALSLTGHTVTLVESASRLAEVGAGVQLTPSATKWFWKWGLGPDILESAVLPAAFIVRKSDSNKILGQVEFADFPEKYGGPYLVIHRADLHDILHTHAINAGTDVHLNSRVADYDFEAGSIKLKDGTEMHADLIVAVDGINSSARKQLVNAADNDNGLQDTGHAAFRLMADVTKIAANPETAFFVASQNCNCTVGDGNMLMTYMIKGKSKLNLVLSHLDDIDTSQWSQQQFRDEIRRIFKDYSGAIKALIGTALADTSQTITNWPIREVRPLKRWTSDSGRFVLIGDAPHAMAFYLSMGVSMAVEDAAALVETLTLHERSNGQSSLAQAMRVFEAVRLPRAKIVMDASRHSGNLLLMPAGPDRDIRDEALRTQGASIRDDNGDYDDQGRHFATTRMSYGIIDSKIRDYFYGHDPANDIRAKWAETVK